MTCCSDSVCACFTIGGRAERSVTAACRAMGIDRSTYLPLEAQGRPLGARGVAVQGAPAAPDVEPARPAHRAAGDRLLARPHPGFGPRRIAAPLAGEMGGPAHLRARRLASSLPLRAQHPLAAAGFDRPPPQDRYERSPSCRGQNATWTPTEPARRSSSTPSSSPPLGAPKGTVWQYTAADVASGFAWAELHATQRNPRARWTPPRHRLSIGLARSPLPQPRRPRR